MSKKIIRIFMVVTMIVTIMLPAIASGQREGYGETSEGRGEHTRDEGNEGAEGEESGTTYMLDETYDFVRKGTRLILNYIPSSNEFVGTIENLTETTLYDVRIEIHLSNGLELGPTTPVDMLGGQTMKVTLQGSEASFDKWTPHAEVGRSEGSGTEGSESSNSEHGSEEGGESSEGSE